VLALFHLEEGQALLLFLFDHSPHWAPLRSIIENTEETERISKWASELRSYGLRYEPGWQSTPGLIVAFIPRATEHHANQLEGWILNVNKASNSRGQASKLCSPI